MKMYVVPVQVGLFGVTIFAYLVKFEHFGPAMCGLWFVKPSKLLQNAKCSHFQIKLNFVDRLLAARHLKSFFRNCI
jgi:hypothetical protein